MRGRDGARLRSIALLVLCQVAAVSAWFAGSAATSAAAASGAFPLEQSGWLSASVQLGFVAGTLTIALTGAADRFDPRRVFAFSAVVCAASTGALLATGLAGWPAIMLRAISGFALAGVYPIGMKLVAGWSRSALGLPMGLLVGALTLGSAMPNLF
ncbi:MAG: MFS transporter, partial [Mesorhizobium sp.]